MIKYLYKKRGNMNKIIGKIYKFMYGRYGIDELYKLGLIICIVLSFINIFIN